jgi:glutathione peroxidase
VRPVKGWDEAVYLLIKDFMHSKFYFLRSLVLTLFALFAFSGMAQKNVYGFKVKDENGRLVSLSKYRGKVLLIVNTATQCGLTPQYKPLQELYDKYRDKGLVVLGFPCNQFKGQAPGTNKEIRQFCEANYGVTFPQFAKIDVNGKNAIPLYRYLKRQQPFFGYLMSDSTQRAEFERLPKDVPINVEYDIQWNFTKFIVDRNGKVVKRVEPKDTMPYLEEEVLKVIGQGR